MTIQETIAALDDDGPLMMTVAEKLTLREYVRALEAVVEVARERHDMGPGFLLHSALTKLDALRGSP